MVGRGVSSVVWLLLRCSAPVHKHTFVQILRECTGPGKGRQVEGGANGKRKGTDRSDKEVLYT